MELKVNKNEHLRHLLVFKFHSGCNATEAARDINTVYGENFIAERTARKWFARFKEGDFSLDDAPRSGRPVDFDEERLQTILREDNRQTTRELAEKLDCAPQTVLNHLNALGKVQKLGAWVPHELTQSTRNQRVTTCASLLARYRRAANQQRPFLPLIVTGDEKWVLYINMKQRKEWVDKDQQATPRVKQNLHPLKTMLCVWWGMEGIIYWELLERNQTITSEVYSQQLRRLADALQRKRPNNRYEIILHHDNARPHIAHLTKMTIEELGWEVLPHPPYSPDIAPSDFHLFRSLSNDLHGVSFTDDKDLRNWLVAWFDSKSRAFYRRGIEKLPELWGKIIDTEGDYIV